ncbi:DUF1097 family protein [Eubacterium limosum]|uniref:DUF1097 family protein n=1 Tax=Eubacterium limosum TaxID=1736 RepID=UPI00106361DE|nr:DUF1097 family protein [Eubacterium limosum]
METKVYWWINGTALGLFVATAFVIITHSPFSGLLAMFFIGLGLTFAKGAKPEKTPNYLFSALSGILWALVYFWMDGALKALGLGPDLSLWIGMFVFSVVTVVVHFIPLKNTWFNELPHAYGAITSVFIMGTRQIPGIICVMLSGILTAVVCGVISNRLTKKIMDYKKTAPREVGSGGEPQ